MKKKIVTLLIATTAMLSLVGCGSTYDKYVSIKDYKNMKITDTNLSQFDYSDEDVKNTIRSSIINYSPSLITETNEPINEKSCISFEGTATNESGEESQFSLSYKMYSELAEIDGLQEGVLGHKTGDEIDLTLNLSSGKLTAHIKITLVANDPLNSFTDEWVKEYGNNEDVETKDDYYKTIETQVKTNKEASSKSEKISAISEKLMKETEMKKYPDGAVEAELKVIKAQYAKLEELYNMDIKSNIMTANKLSTDKDYEKYLKTLAEEQVKQNTIYNNIAEKEKLTPTEDEYTKKLKEYTTEHKDSYDSVDIIGEDAAKQYILNTIVEDWLYQNNSVTEK